VPIDVNKLQKIVDKMSKPGKEKWVLDHTLAPSFFEFVSPYIKKAAYKSEYNAHGDPEDAFAEVRWEVWKALEKYGPRPKGNLFGDYTLKLKTNNVLTNREKKRASYKSRLNFVSESLDSLEAQEREGERCYIPPSCAHFDLCLLKEELIKRSKKENQRVIKLINKINRLKNKEKLEVFYSLMSSITGEPYENCVKQFINLFFTINFLNKLKPFLYNKSDDKNILELEDVMQNALENVKVGDKFVTKTGGKVIEIRSKGRNGFKILVMLTGKVIDVENDYIQNYVEPYEDVDDPVEKTFETAAKEAVEKVIEEPVKEPVKEPVEKVTEKDIIELHEEKSDPKVVKQVKKESSKKPKTNKKSEKKGKKKMNKTPKETKKAFVLSLLKEGTQTRESLANAIIEKGLSKHNDVTKEKSYASVILHNLKKDGIVFSHERGKYTLDAPAETTEEN